MTRKFMEMSKLKIYKFIIINSKRPELIKCPYCGIKTMTSIEFINGYNSYLLSLVIVLVLGIGVSILIAPLAYILSKTLIHR